MIGDGEQIVVTNLVPGQYTSTEIVPAGWDLVSIICDDKDEHSGGGDLLSARVFGSDTAVFNLDAGETITCVFTNEKLPPPAVPAIDIEKATNGQDADEPTGPILYVGDTVTWTYVVTNTGNVDLTDVAVTDDILGDICTIGDLAAGATDTCEATGIAELGQYANLGTVTGHYAPLRENVVDKDPSHYYGSEVPVPAIDIEKATNGQDADEPTGPILYVGDTVTWTYVVTNTGNVDLTDVAVTDDILGDICTIGDLAAGATDTCEATGIAELDQYANLGTVTGNYGTVVVTDKDPSHYAAQAVLGTAQLGDTVWYDTNKNGVQDSGEPGINGAIVTLKDGSGTVVATATTATGPWDGFYKFLELDAGTYTATLDMSSVKSTYELTTAGSFTVTLEEGDDYLDADFGLYETEDEALPKTGFNSGELALIAIGMLMLGTLAVLAARKYGFEEE